MDPYVIYILFSLIYNIVWIGLVAVSTIFIWKKTNHEYLTLSTIITLLIGMLLFGFIIPTFALNDRLVTTLDNSVAQNSEEEFYLDRLLRYEASSFTNERGRLEIEYLVIDIQDASECSDDDVDVYNSLKYRVDTIGVSYFFIITRQDTVGCGIGTIFD